MKKSQQRMHDFLQFLRKKRMASKVLALYLRMNFLLSINETESYKFKYVQSLLWSTMRKYAFIFIFRIKINKSSRRYFMMRMCTEICEKSNLNPNLRCSQFSCSFFFTHDVFCFRIKRAYVFVLIKIDENFENGST